MVITVIHRVSQVYSIVEFTTPVLPGQKQAMEGQGSVLYLLAEY